MCPANEPERAARPVSHEKNESERAMRSLRIGLKGGVFVVALGTALVVGCGDDDTEGDGGEGGEGGTAGSSSGNGGKAGGSGGKAGGSTAGSSNDGGMSTEPMGGTGGSDPNPPVGGEGGVGSGGDGGSGEVTFDPITQVGDDVYTEANDLRGLSFSSKLPGKLWASGHIGIIPNPATLNDPDKKVVIARFDADGTPDETFDGDGFLEVNLVERVIDTVPDVDVVLNDGNEESLGIVELDNGDIIVSANVRDAAGKGMDAVLARYTAAGAPVTNFGTNGVAIVDFGWPVLEDVNFPGAPAAAPSDSSQHIELDTSTQGTEKIVVYGAGSAAKGQLTGTAPNQTQRTDNDRYVTRVLATTGAIDPAFNSAKPFFYNSGAVLNDNARRGIVEADGSILAAGYVNLGEGQGNHVAVIRLLPNGAIDAAFGHGVSHDGVLRSNPVIDDGGVAECYNVVRQSDGRIVTAGYGSATGPSRMSSFNYASTVSADLVSFAYSPDGGELDEAWGNVGMFIGQSEGTPGLTRFEERGRDMSILPDQRLVYAGNYGEDPAIFVATPDGLFEPENDEGYLFTYEPLTTTTNQTTGSVSTSHFFRVTVSPDGKLIAAATNQNVDGVLVAVLKVGE
jgi:uncharacterized delta-60 repeat protein